MFLLVLTVEKELGFGIGFFPLAWGLVITVALTRLVCSRISHERPLSAVLSMAGRELTTPRERAKATGGAASVGRVRVAETRPRPKQKAGQRG